MTETRPVDQSRLFADLPAHWREERLHDVSDLRTSNVDKKSAKGESPVKLCNYVDVYHHDCITSEVEFMEATATEAEMERFALHPGDVVITKDSESPDDIGVPAVIAEAIPDLVCGYHLTIIRPDESRADGHYLRYALASRLSAYQFYLAANGVTRFGLTYDGTKNIRIAIPPVSEQKEIAAFLDWKTSQIDALIAKKRELVEKLKEKRLAAITHAVTRGVAPTCSRTFGTYRGSMPSHWSFIRLRFLLCGLDQGWSPKASNVAAEGEEKGVLKLSAVASGAFVPRENKFLDEIPESQVIQSPRSGDILLTRANTPQLVGDACVVEQDFPTLVIPDLIYRLTVDRSQSDPRFLVYFLLSKAGRAQIEALARGSSGSMVKLGQGHLKDFEIPAPPLEEQVNIANFLDDENQRILAMIGKIESAVERLTEYRTAVITAATTGKIDIRQVLVPKPTTSPASASESKPAQRTPAHA